MSILSTEDVLVQFGYIALETLRNYRLEDQKMALCSPTPNVKVPIARKQ